MGWLPVVPTVTLPKFSGAGATDKTPAVVATPVPLNGKFTLGPFEALLVMDKDPDNAPVLEGLKATLNDELCPAGIVSGKEIPLRTNCELLLVSDDTVTLPPLALRVMV